MLPKALPVRSTCETFRASLRPAYELWTACHQPPGYSEELGAVHANRQRMIHSHFAFCVPGMRMPSTPLQGPMCSWSMTFQKISVNFNNQIKKHVD
mmetsp:Transcript_59139/g.108435  ORF Transcript_59139/g.108435 Transcript_59139/m.108435 type:complete len:96 (+) Transcript_59139:394-681(+)